MELNGWTAIDTVYELKGFEMASAFAGPLYWTLIAVFLVAGIIWTLWKASQYHRHRMIATYFIGSILMIYLLQPVSVQVNLPANYTYDESLADLVETTHQTGRAKATVDGVPRIMHWTHYAVDTLSSFLTSSVNDSFKHNPFEHDRAVVLLKHSRIEDSDLREQYHTFVIGCYLQALASRQRDRRDPPDPYWDPFKLDPSEYARWMLPPPEKGFFQSEADYIEQFKNPPPELRCEVQRNELFRDLLEHVESSSDHEDAREAVLEALRQKGIVGNSQQIENKHQFAVDVILRYILFNETYGLFSTNEIQMLQAALPDYEMFDRKTMSHSNAEHWTLFASQGSDYFGGIRTSISWVVKIIQSVDQWISHHGEGPALYFKVTSYGPYIYGLALMIVCAIFPFAGFVALLPGKWSVLITWGKMVLWIKLWMVCWAIFSKFNEWRWSIDGWGSDPENGIGDQSYIFPAIAAMYLFTPMLSGLAVSLLSAASSGVGGALGMAPSGGAGGINTFEKVWDGGGQAMGKLGGEDAGAGAAAGGGRAGAAAAGGRAAAAAAV